MLQSLGVEISIKALRDNFLPLFKGDIFDLRPCIFKRLWGFFVVLERLVLLLFPFCFHFGLSSLYLSM